MPTQREMSFFQTIPPRCTKDASHFAQAECRWSKTDANALLAIKCRFENRRWPTSVLGKLAAPRPPDRES